MKLLKKKPFDNKEVETDDDERFKHVRNQHAIEYPTEGRESEAG